MSPLKIKKLSKIRSELDKLDNLLIKLIKKRTFFVKKVLLLKEKYIRGIKNPKPISLPKKRCAHSDQKITLNSLIVIE